MYIVQAYSSQIIPESEKVIMRYRIANWDANAEHAS